VVDALDADITRQRRRLAETTPPLRRRSIHHAEVLVDVAVVDALDADITRQRRRRLRRVARRPRAAAHVQRRIASRTGMTVQV